MANRTKVDENDEEPEVVVVKRTRTKNTNIISSNAKSGGKNKRGANGAEVPPKRKPAVVDLDP